MSKNVDILEHRRKNSQSLTNIICVIVLIRFVDFWLKCWNGIYNILSRTEAHSSELVSFLCTYVILTGLDWVYLVI